MDRSWTDSCPMFLLPHHTMFYNPHQYVLYELHLFLDLGSEHSQAQQSEDLKQYDMYMFFT